MDETIFYPGEDLETISTAQGKKLYEAWQAHLTHLNHSVLQPASQLGGQGGESFQQYMTTWSQNLEKYYEAFATFTGLLNTGARHMETLDTDLGQTFESGPSHS